MSLDIGTALREGADRTASRPALLLMVAFLAIALVSTALSQTLLVDFTEFVADLAREQGQDPGFDPDTIAGESPLALPLSAPVAAALALVVALASEALSVVAVRVFVADADAAVPGGVGRRLVSATVNGFVGGIVVYVFVLFGLVLLVVPGIFLFLSFYFVRQVIAVEDANFVTAMSRSWALSKGNRIELLGLAIVLLVVSLAASAPSIGLDAVNSTLGAAAGLVISAVVGVFVVATVSRAYAQLREDADDEPAEEAEPPSDPYDAALGYDDLPEP